MKTKDLIKLLEDKGYRFLRSSSHKLYSNGTHTIAIPHHTEVNKFLANKIKRTIETGVNYYDRRQVA